MGNHEGSPAADHRIDGRLDLLLGQGVHGGRRLIQYKDPGIRKNGPGKGNQLFLPGGEQVAALAHIRIDALFHTGHHLIGGNQLQGPVDLFVRRVRVAVEQIFPDGAGEKMGRLQHIADGAVEPELAPFPGVPPVDQDAARGRLIKAADQVYQRALAGTGFTDDGNIAAEGNFQAEMFQHILVPVRITERDVLKSNIAADGFPVLLLRIKGIAVLLNHLRRIRHIGGCADKPGQPLDVHLGGNDIRNGVHNPADRFHHALGIGHEHRKRAHFLRRDQPALPQDDGQRHGGGQVHRDGESAAEPGRMHGRVPVFLGIRHKVSRHPVLNGQGLDGFGAGDGFIEIPCDP